MSQALDLDLPQLRRQYLDGTLALDALVDRLLAARQHSPAGVWIQPLPEAALRARARELAAHHPAELPLYGIPFAVKDNLHVAGLPTTAACPAFSHIADHTAPAVARLLAAGAILVGKTNLDQFATGLVGTRSPYGECENAFDPAYLSGGSSSGSAVAVASGQVSFALGTDTAGSGRVPAAFNNIVGLKPTRGRVSNRGVVPACRSLDCVSVFAPTVAGAMAVLEHLHGFDFADPYSRAETATHPLDIPSALDPGRCRLGVPAQAALRFFGDPHTPELFAAALAGWQQLGAELVTVDYEPFAETAALLYHGPWLAERYGAVDEAVGGDWDKVLPVIREVLAPAAGQRAVEAFAGLHHLQALRRAVAPLWERMDALLLPTAGTCFTRAQVAAEPVLRNSELGYYTNFVNLLDLCGLALPAGFTPAGLPFGITLLAPAWQEPRLAALGEIFQNCCGPAPGWTDFPSHRGG